MKLLIKPASFVQMGVSPPPLGLLYLAAMTPEDTTVWDAHRQGEPTDLIRKAQIVGAQVYTPGRHESFNYLKIAKANGAITVAGGPHVAVQRKRIETYDYIDHLVVGDGELAWKCICDYYDGKSSERPPKVLHMPVKHLDDLPIPAWGKINMPVYLNRICIVLGRGCDGSCIFCSTWWISGKYHCHGEAWITEELQVLWDYGVRHLVWDDDCLTNDPDGTQALINAMGKFRFSAEGTTRVDKVTQSMVRDLKRVGFRMLGFGIESGSQTILDKMHKQTDLSTAFAARQWCRENDIRFKALVMHGFPFETDETRREDNEFRVKLAPDEWGSVGFIQIFPGTQMYRDLKKEGKISDDFWDGPEPYYRIG